MQLRQLRYLIAVAEHGNFTRAAEALHVSQPALSQQILQIEDRLGVSLLDRRGRSVSLTDAGVAYIAHARRALYELESGRRAIQDVRDLSRGLVRLAMTPTFTAYLVGPLVADFRAHYPGVHLSIREMSLDTIAAAVAADEVDFGIAFQPTHSPEIAHQPLFIERLSAAVGDCHPWAKRGVIDVGQTAQLDLALLSTDFVTRTNIDQFMLQYRVAPNVVVEANTISALVEIVKSTTLVTILPEPICAAIPGLNKLNFQPGPLPRTVMYAVRMVIFVRPAGPLWIC